MNDKEIRFYGRITWYPDGTSTFVVCPYKNRLLVRLWFWYIKWR